MDLSQSPPPFDSTYNGRNMAVGAQFECLIKELGRKHRYVTGKFDVVLWKFWWD